MYDRVLTSVKMKEQNTRSRITFHYKQVCVQMKTNEGHMVLGLKFLQDIRASLDMEQHVTLPWT